MVINTRSRAVLNQVVTLHYQTCEPVGSASICKTRVLPVSPATIRNIMGRLENTGHLSQPHTSAGRLPTDLGYRTYVDGIKLEGQPLEEQEKRSLNHQLNNTPNTSGMLTTIAEHIHNRTDLVTFHLPFRHSGIRMKHLHLERINRERLLALLISNGGQTFQSILDIDEDEVGAQLAEKVANFFNNAYQGNNLLEIQRSLNLNSAGGTWDILLGGAVKIVARLVEEASQLDSLTFQGLTKVLEMPEFQDLAKVKSIFRILEQQAKIKKLIHRTLECNDWLVFYIGSENDDPDLEGLSLAVAKFKNSGNWLGCVGVLGPKRMPYLRAMQMMRYAEEAVANRTN